MIEKDIENRLVLQVEKIGGQALKFEVPGKAGMPDRLILVPGGSIIFVEVKAPGEKPRPLQKKRMRDLEEMGFKTRVVDSYDSIDRLIGEIIWQSSYLTTTKNIQ